MASTTTLINGVNYSWSNIILVLFGVPVVGITEISYKRTQKKENNHGMGSEPVSRGYGDRNYDGSITIYYDELKRIISSMPAGLNNDITQIPPFNIQVLFEGVGVPYTVDKLIACEFLEDPMSTKSGDTAIKVKLPLIIGGIQK
jgi:hypothetical protein